MKKMIASVLILAGMLGFAGCTFTRTSAMSGKRKPCKDYYISSIRFLSMENKLFLFLKEKLIQFLINNFYKPFIKVVDEVRANDGAENRIKPVESDEMCPKCGKVMLIRESRFGKFLACSGYPECKTTKPFDKPVCKCPKCGNDIYKRRSKKGKYFYGCSGYPNCDFVAFDEPTGELCSKCKSPLVKVKDVVKCSNRNCQ